MEGTNKAHENGEAMGFVGVRLTVMLGRRYWFLCCVSNEASRWALVVHILKRSAKFWVGGYNIGIMGGLAIEY